MRLFCNFFDYFYSDADYTLSSARDHARDTFKAHTGMESVVSCSKM